LEPQLPVLQEEMVKLMGAVLLPAQEAPLTAQPVLIAREEIVKVHY
jgi:hypothetical protein